MGNSPSNRGSTTAEGLEPYEYFITEGQKCVVASQPLVVREGANFDSRRIAVLKPGTALEVLELGEASRVRVAAVGASVKGWVSFKSEGHGPLIVPQLDFAVLDTGVVVEPTVVRQGEDLDSQEIGVLDEGTVLKVLEIGKIPRRIRVAALGDNTEGWVSYKTLQHEPLVVPEQSYKAAWNKGLASAIPAPARESSQPEAPAPAATTAAAEPSPDAPAAEHALPVARTDAPEAPVAGSEQAAQQSAAGTPDAHAEPAEPTFAAAKEEVAAGPALAAAPSPTEPVAGSEKSAQECSAETQESAAKAQEPFAESPVVTGEEEAAGPPTATVPAPTGEAGDSARAVEHPAAPEGNAAPAPAERSAAPTEYIIQPGDTCVAANPVVVREGESFDSDLICGLEEGAVLGVLELGKAPRRVRVVVVGTYVQGWVSFKTQDNDLLLVPEQEIERWRSFKTLQHEPLLVPEQSYEAPCSKGLASGIPVPARESSPPEAPAPAAATAAAEPSPDSPATEHALPAAPADASEAPVAGSEQVAQQSAAETLEAHAEPAESTLAVAEEEKAAEPAFATAPSPMEPVAGAEQAAQECAVETQESAAEAQEIFAESPVAAREEEAAGPSAVAVSAPTGQAGEPVRAVEHSAVPEGKAAPAPAERSAVPTEFVIHPGDTCVVVKPVVVREGESFDSDLICGLEEGAVLDEGTVLKVLEIGKIPRRIRVAALGVNTKGWVSFTTLQHEPVVVPEQSYEAAWNKGLARAIPAPTREGSLPRRWPPRRPPPQRKPSPDAPAAEHALPAAPADAPEAPTARSEQAAQQSTAETPEAHAEPAEPTFAAAEEEVAGPALAAAPSPTGAVAEAKAAQECDAETQESAAEVREVFAESLVAAGEEAAGPPAAADPAPTGEAGEPARAVEHVAVPEAKAAPAPAVHSAAPTEYVIQPGDTCVAVSPVVVREGESFDSDLICELEEGAVLGVLELGEAPRRVRVMVVGTVVQGWVSFKTPENDLLLVPEQEIEMFAQPHCHRSITDTDGI